MTIALHALAGLIALSVCLHAQPVPQAPSAGEQFLMAERRVQHADSSRRNKAMYRWSVGALIGANAADIASSWGKREGNPALRNSDGRFGWSGVAIKSGITGGVLLAEWWILRRHRTQHKALAWTNYSLAGAIGAVSIRNFGVRR